MNCHKSQFNKSGKLFKQPIRDNDKQGKTRTNPGDTGSKNPKDNTRFVSLLVEFAQRVENTRDSVSYHH